MKFIYFSRLTCFAVDFATFATYKAVESGGKRWKAVESGGKRWKAVESGGKRWKAVESGGKRWKAVESGGKRWKAVIYNPDCSAPRPLSDRSDLIL